ncbi:hypothetical protein RR48_01041 [Papilio machaon]|uniref:SAP domain-containing protein n=1 Tax=Papilio machaon TaxID=76193 RepID=A0A0N1PIY9_PAPMA|nr:hypothetical protein RR48_01041 [Papilio machaon]
MTKAASTRRVRNQAASLTVPRQNSLPDNGRAKQNTTCEMLAAMNKEQLRAECRKRGQRSSGNKNELSSRNKNTNQSGNNNEVRAQAEDPERALERSYF